MSYKYIPVNPMKLCSSFYGSTENSKEHYAAALITEGLGAIRKCVGWSQVNPKELPTILGEGSYGLVIGDELKSKKRVFARSKKMNVAIKIQTAQQRELQEIQRELDYAIKLGQLNLGPKLYKRFYYRLKDKKGEIQEQYRVIFIMQRGTPADIKLYGGYNKKIPAHSVASIVRQMLEIIERVTEQNIFCRDIKANNFITLEDPKTGEFMVRMIDFGGDFCRDLPPIFIHEIRQYAREQERKTAQPKLQAMYAATEQKDEHYPKYLFARVLQISLILQIFNAMMNQLKGMGLTFQQRCLNVVDSGVDYCRYIKTVLAPAVPIVAEVCNDDAILYNITESIINSNDLYRVFIHYVNPKKLAKLGMMTPSGRREIVLHEFNKVCLIDKWLRGIPRSKPQPKPGKRAALSRWLRGLNKPRTPPAAVHEASGALPSSPVTSLSTISLSTKSGGKKTRRRRRKSRRRRRKSRRRRRKSRKKKH